MRKKAVLWQAGPEKILRHKPVISPKSAVDFTRVLGDVLSAELPDSQKKDE